MLESWQEARDAINERTDQITRDTEQDFRRRGVFGKAGRDRLGIPVSTLALERAGSDPILMCHIGNEQMYSRLAMMFSSIAQTEMMAEDLET